MIKKMEREIGAIDDLGLQYGVVEIITPFEEILEWCPSSASGKFHTSDPLLINHLRRTFRIAYSLCEHEHLPKPNFDITITAALIHDIGKCTGIRLDYPGAGAIETEPDNWKCYQEKYWVYRPDWVNHAISGAREIMKCDNLPYRQEIVEMVLSHHNLWDPEILRVRTLESRIVSMADYLASRNYIKFAKGWSNYDR